MSIGATGMGAVGPEVVGSGGWDGAGVLLCGVEAEMG